MTTRTLAAIDFQDPDAPAWIRPVHIGSTVLVTGQVDAFTVRQFESTLFDAVRNGAVDTLDLSGVNFFGSDGVEPLKDFSRLFVGRIVTSAVIDRVLGLLGIDLLTRH